MTDPLWIPPNVKEMLGEWWEQYAKRNGITWEMGPPRSTDHLGNTYVSLDWNGPHGEGGYSLAGFTGLAELFDRFERSLTNFLGQNKHVIWRRFPEFGECITRWYREEVETSHAMNIRARLTCYPQKP